ncbi:MAG: aspartate aminotransferase family protein [Clostridiales bacterium]|nr:aspartate aminotransferase family protein [Clostridiales bacterium]
MNFQTMRQKDGKHCIQNYGRYAVAFDHGKGSLLYDFEGKEYIDFSSGIGVNSIGHANPHWVEAISRQAEKLAHVSNLFFTEPYCTLAQRLTTLAGMKATFFCNSGAEANEAAMKLARKYSHDKYGEGRSVIVTLNQSFHGRTMATLTATGQPDYHMYFAPFVEGFRYVKANDEESLKQSITPEVCAIMVEGIQGEGGVIPLDREFVERLASLAMEHDILLIFDEVQTGNGRTGDFFSYQGFGVSPDLVTTAKGLGGGLPIGALLANEKCSSVLTPGTHGSTFGGNPIACAGANAVLDIVTEDGFLEQVGRKGDKIRQTVAGWKLPIIKDVRGKGLMLGIEIKDISTKEIMAGLLEKGLVILTAGTNVLRLLPPLTITDSEIDQGLRILYKHLVNL